MSKVIKIIQGIKEVLSVPTAYTLTRNDSLSKFEFTPLITKIPRTQLDVDALKIEVERLKFYEGIIYNKETAATLMAITFNNASLNSKRRLNIVKEIKTLTEAFAVKHNVQMHYSRMPYIRSQMMEKFMIKGFREMLVDIQNFSMKEQAIKIENELTAWQKDFEQTDDILLIGIRF